MTSIYLPCYKSRIYEDAQCRKQIGAMTRWADGSTRVYFKDKFWAKAMTQQQGEQLLADTLNKSIYIVEDEQ